MSKEEFLVFLHQLCHRVHSKEVLAAPLLHTRNIHIQRSNTESTLRHVDIKTGDIEFSLLLNSSLLKIYKNKYRLKTEDIHRCRFTSLNVANSHLLHMVNCLKINTTLRLTAGTTVFINQVCICATPSYVACNQYFSATETVFRTSTSVYYTNWEAPAM